METKDKPKPGCDEYGCRYFPWQGHLLIVCFWVFVLYMMDEPMPKTPTQWAFGIFAVIALHVMTWSVIASMNRYSNNMFSLAWLRRLLKPNKP